MKKTIIFFVIAILVILSAILWIFNTDFANLNQEYLILGGIVIVAGFALFIGFSRLKSIKQNEPAEDELSKKIMTKTSSVSYYISLYFWLILMYFSEKLNLETNSIIGIGIVGMAVIFLLSWIFVKIKGLGNE